MGRPTKNRWVVGFKPFAGSYTDLSGMEVIEYDGDGYLADPFVVGNYVFVEEYVEGKGRISVIDLEKMNLTTVIEEEHHMSFPNIIMHGGEYYMLPEEGAINQVRLWKATSFPFEWEVAHTIIRGGMHPGDSEIFFYNDKVYLFTTSGSDHLMYLLESDELLGAYRYVQETEIPNSRPAGKMFVDRGRIIRPVQKCENQYGEALILKTVSLDPYTEFESEELSASWIPNLNGFHTLNYNDRWIVVDGRYET